MTSSSTVSAFEMPTFAGPVSFLGAAEAAKVDEQLMAPDGPYQFTLEQLMELAGLSVAQAVADFVSRDATAPGGGRVPRILVVCGPGNNGGDGIVAARHLALFFPSASVELVFPKFNTKNAHFGHLLAQAVACGAKRIEELPPASELRGTVIVDAIFGFSFNGTPRPPFDAVIQTLNTATTPEGADAPARLCCVDIPSGWGVETGLPSDEAAAAAVLRHPSMLISLTLPKKGVFAVFEGDEAGTGRARAPPHYLGGRFVPAAMAAANQWRMPQYAGFHQAVRLVAPKAIAS